MYTWSGRRTVPETFGRRSSSASTRRRERLDIHAGLGQDGRREPVLLLQQRRHQVFDIDLLLAVADRLALRGPDRFLRLLGETIDVHTTYFDAETREVSSRIYRIKVGRGWYERQFAAAGLVWRSLWCAVMHEQVSWPIKAGIIARNAGACTARPGIDGRLFVTQSTDRVDAQGAASREREPLPAQSGALRCHQYECKRIVRVHSEEPGLDDARRRPTSGQACRHTDSRGCGKLSENHPQHHGCARAERHPHSDFARAAGHVSRDHPYSPTAASAREIVPNRPTSDAKSRSWTSHVVDLRLLRLQIRSAEARGRCRS